MAPFRSRDRSNRSGRGQIEHNVLEGLPINQFREQEITIEPHNNDTKRVDKDAWPEPPMPRDSHLLPEHAQQILRAARSGRIYKPPAPPQEDREGSEEEEEHKQVQHGFTVKKWVKVARHLEEPEPEYLAKRRKGLPSQYSSAHGHSAALLRETKVQKVDADGNITVYKALVPEGQTVEGEIQATDTALADVAPASAVPGTVVEGVGIVNAEGVVVAGDIVQQTPPRRKPPPPKKKKGGPGRGKKKVIFVEGQTEQGTPAPGSDLLAPPVVKQEGGSADPSDIDTPMADAGDEDGEEESGDEDGEEREHSPTPADSNAPAKTPQETTQEPTPVPEPITSTEAAASQDMSSSTEVVKAEEDLSTAPTSVQPVEQADAVEPEPEKIVKSQDGSSSPDMPLSVTSHSRQNSTNQIPTLSDLAPPSEIPVKDTAEAAPISDATSAPVEAVTTPSDAQPLPSADVSVPTTEPVPTTTESTDPVLPEPENLVAESAPVAVSVPSPQAAVAPEADPVPEALPEKISPAPAQPAAPTEEVQGSDGEPDLLGSLEAHLDQQSQQ